MSEGAAGVPADRLADAYRAATESAALIDRSERRSRVAIHGRAPAKMLEGILTCTVPGNPLDRADGVHELEGSYGAILTPKGKTVTDFRITRVGPDEQEGFLLDLPAAGRAGTLAYFKQYLPPRFAKVAEVSDATGHLTLMGSKAAEWISREVTGLRVETAGLTALAENDGFLLVAAEGGRSTPESGIEQTGGAAADAPPRTVVETLRVVRNADVATAAWDLIGPQSTLRSLMARATETEVTVVGSEVAEALWTTLRIEAGRPAFGIDFDDDTIPVEAGIHHRAIDYQKGCYTGQEVIIRIRDRGRVNRHIRGLIVGDPPGAEPGTEVWLDGHDRPMGVITSVAASPGARAVLALAMLRREVEVPGGARLGGPEGPAVEVRAVPIDPEGAAGWWWS